VSLGYKPTEASRAVSAVSDDSIKSSEELIRRALQSMVNA
jgi:Holliday junction DNA helicase RuvA